MSKNPHILNAASNLLGIALLIIAGINIAEKAGKTIADDVAWIAAVGLMTSCILSYFAIRSEPEVTRFEDWADKIFIGGLLMLFAAVVILAFTQR